MGFAKLIFKADGTETIGNVLADITRVISGAVTSPANLTTANTTSSYIYNSAGRGDWTNLYDATPIGTAIPKVLSAPCLNGQTKYIHLGQLGYSRNMINQTSSTLYQYTGLSSAGAAGIALVSCTNATARVTLTNPSYYNSSGTNQPIYFNAIIGTEVYLSWSSRHCLIAGSSQGTNNRAEFSITASFEYDGDSINDARSTAPICHAQWFGAVDTTQPPLQPNTTATGGPTTFSVLNHFRPDTSILTGTRNILGELSPSVDYHTITNNNSAYRPAGITKTSSGAAAIYLHPLYWHQHQMGIPHCYISDLCKVYVARSTPGEAGDTITVGSDTYVYLPWPQGGKGIVCLRA